MLDDLRNSASNSFAEEDPLVPSHNVIRIQPKEEKLFLGMTAAQRFVVTLMLFLMVSVLGALVLVVSGAVYLPF